MKTTVKNQRMTANGASVKRNGVVKQIDTLATYNSLKDGLRLSDLEMTALETCAEFRKGGDMVQYVRDWLIAGLENDLDVLRHEIKAKGGAR